MSITSNVAFAFIAPKDKEGNLPEGPTMIGLFLSDELVATITYENMWSVVDFMYEHLPPRNTVMSVS